MHALQLFATHMFIHFLAHLFISFYFQLFYRPFAYFYFQAVILCVSINFSLCNTVCCYKCVYACFLRYYFFFFFCNFPCSFVVFSECVDMQNLHCFCNLVVLQLVVFVNYNAYITVLYKVLLNIFLDIFFLFLF